MIEIDGDSHTDPDQSEYELARTKCLEERRYKVIRFSNNDALHHLDNLLAELLLVCQERAFTPTI